MEDPPILFVSLGMFIIDTIITHEGTTLDDIIGGAGTFAAVGSRLFTAPRQTGFIVDYGSDTPSEVEAKMESFGFNADVRRNEKRKCTRGLNTYRGDVRLFEYLTPKIRITGDQLSPAFLRSASFHLICGPERCLELVSQLGQLRSEIGCTAEMVTVWEPVPDACVSKDRKLFDEAMKVVSILSPNKSEAAGILDCRDQLSQPGIVEQMTDELISSGAKTVIIRCSEKGAFLGSPTETAWFPAFYQDQTQVIDPTGGGNAFCGAIAVSLAQQTTISAAMIRATVAAAVAISQIGVPELTRDLAGRELWNGRRIEDMMNEYRGRLAKAP